LTRELPHQQINRERICTGFIDAGMSKGIPDEGTQIFKNRSRLGDWVSI